MVKLSMGKNEFVFSMNWVGTKGNLGGMSSIFGSQRVEPIF